LRRPEMLRAVADRLPELYSYWCSASFFLFVFWSILHFLWGRPSARRFNRALQYNTSFVTQFDK